MDRVKVLIVDDNMRYRWAVMEALIVDPSIEVVEEASDGQEAVEKAKAVKPDVVLMDLLMPNVNGLEATLRLKAEMPDIRILINTISDHEPYLQAALRAGAQGYLLKQDKPELFVHAIHYVAKGGTIFSRSVAAKLREELEGQKPRVGGLPEGFPDESGEEIEKTPPENAPEVHPTSAESEQPQGAAQQVGAGSTIERESTVAFAQLVISPPVEPSVLLRLHYSLSEIPTAIIESIRRSSSGDMLLNIAFNTPFELMRLLSELPFVAEVSTEPSTEEQRTPLPHQQALIRLVLKTE
ncbi:response regulator transcription factor [Chloroflexota bacterium]